MSASAANSEVVRITTDEFEELIVAANEENPEGEVFLHEGKILEFEGTFYNEVWKCPFHSRDRYATLFTAESVKTQVQTVAQTVEGFKNTKESIDLVKAIQGLTEIIDLLEKAEQ